jgi:hypothetical protein
MANNNQNNKDINYLGKDFNQFKENLIAFAKTYYKNTFNDLNEGDPNMMFIEMGSYIGDVLSYYTDYNLKENLFSQTTERANILDIAQSMGYKPRPTYPARTTLNIYQIIPSIQIANSTTPDWSYALAIKPNMEITSNENSQVIFHTTDTINFAVSGSNDSTDITVYKLNETTGIIDYYLLMKQVQVEAGVQKTIQFNFGASDPYISVTIPDTSIISIDSVVDSNGNNWYEVPFLAQDTIFIDQPNTTTNSPELATYKNQTPYLLKQLKVSKRFITRYTSDNKLELRFGSGNSVMPDEIITPNPDNVGLPFMGGLSKINTTWDPANFLYTKSYGQVPVNTTLTVKYTVGGGIQSNTPANTLQTISNIEYFTSDQSINPNVLALIKQSVSCTNLNNATGGRGAESVDEIRDNAMSFFIAQDRAVTLEDYIIRTYSMPAKFGSIAKAYITQDDQLNFFDYSQRIANPLALNLYILSYNSQKQLVQTNTAIKENLKTYLSKFKMLTDSINIKDAFVINIAVSFEITVLSNYIASEVLLRAIDNVKSYFDIDKWQINQPIIKNEVVQVIANTVGVQSVISLRFYNQFDQLKGYVPNIYNLETSKRNGIIYTSADPSIWEIRFPQSDIYGRVRNY